MTFKWSRPLLESLWWPLYNKKAVLPQGNRAMPQVFFSVEVRQHYNIHYKYKTSQASKAATLQSSKHAGAKRNLAQNQDSKSIKVTCLESVEKQWGNK